MKTNTLIWLLLLGLTAGAALASGQLPVRVGAGVVLGAALGKALLVAVRFMELHHAHRLWLAVMGMLLAGLSGLFWFLS